MNIQLLLLAASAEGHHEVPLIDIDGTVFVQGGIFLVMLILLTRLVFRPYLRLREEQEANTTGARERADREMTQAAEQLESYEQQVMKAKKEAAAKRTEVRAEGEAQAQQLVGIARHEADRKLARTREELAKSAPAARLALRTRADELARVVAARVLGRELG